MTVVAQVPLRKYFPYACFVRLKRLVGLPCDRHRSYFLQRIIRALENGRITGRLEITAAGKRDGVGAQALARISARCFAAAYGLRYVHTPFEVIAHAELPMGEWVEAWERLLDIGRGAPLAAESALPQVDLETYAMTPSLWREDRVLSVRHYHTFCELAPEYGVRVARQLSERFVSRNREKPRDPSAPLEVRVHVRRGDVRVGDAQTGHRFTSNKSIICLIETVVRAVRSIGRGCAVRLYSQGTEAEFEEFRRVPGLELRLGLPALETFRELTESDVLLMARSDFSHVAAMYGRGVNICDPRHRAPLPGWLLIDPQTGRIDEAELVTRLTRSNAG